MTFLILFAGAFVGAVAGLMSGGSAGAGSVIGIVFAVVFQQTQRLRARVANLEKALRAATPVPKAFDETTDVHRAPEPMPAPRGAEATPPVTAREVRPTRGASVEQEAATTEIAARCDRVSPKPVDPAAAMASGATAAVRRWITQGNVPAKVGVLVLFLGVAALFKYAADRGWLHLPIRFRLIGVAVAAVGALAFAWRKRASHRHFALSLQGGAIGVLLVTVFSAYRLYALLPAAPAFVLLVGVVAGGAVLAIAQDAIALAVLAVVGGFLAPILTSTGDGSHLVLFAYYAVLNAAIFGIAWMRPWRVLNLVGFAFTFCIGILWGVTRYRAELFASTEPFLLLFFAFYLALPILYALRRRAECGGLVVDGTLVFGTPLVAFALQVGLLDQAPLPLAWTAIGAAAIYASLATLALRRWQLVLLGQSHALLALGFATLAVPLALSARSTSCTWALEGAALVWLGLRQQRSLPQAIGRLLQLGAAGAFVVSFRDHPHFDSAFNGAFANALLIAVAALVTARLVALAGRRDLARGTFLWGWAWLWLAIGGDIVGFAPLEQQVNLGLTLFAVTGLVASELRHRWQWDECGWPAVAMFPLALATLAASRLDRESFIEIGPLEHWAGVAWAFWLLCASSALRRMRHDAPVRVCHALMLWLVALLLGMEAGHVCRVHLRLGPIWQAFAGLAPLASMFRLVLDRHRLVRWPLADGADKSRRGLLVSFAAVLGIVAVFGLFAAGDPTPLGYVPLLNPVELGQIVFLLLLTRWFASTAREGQAVVDAEMRARGLALASVALLTSVTLRGVHLLGGVPWGPELWDSPIAEAALSITWTLAGIAAMLLGQRRRSRAVWFGGATLMAVVVAKLLLVDRRFLHDLPSIIGVLVVGVLLVVVGYFAPVPPRTTGQAAGS